MTEPSRWEKEAGAVMGHGFRCEDGSLSTICKCERCRKITALCARVEKRVRKECAMLVKNTRNIAVNATSLAVAIEEAPDGG